MRTNLAQPITIEQLARLGHMSVSAFYQRFKAVTALSPLQYHKVLRLHEARRLMLFQGMDAGGAGREVGYASASQFSREYARLFGSAPTKDVARLRDAAVGGARGVRLPSR
jgi:AraC-like DNA-binding protein